MPGFTVIVEGQERKLDKYETFDLDQFKTMLILQTRETLKTGIRRLDAIHDMMFFPMVKNEPASMAWFGHKLPEAIRQGQAIKDSMCQSDRFNEVWGGIMVPEHRNPDKWGTQEYFNTPVHPEGHPERTIQFLAVKTRYEGGRYKRGHFDDLVTGEDRDSLAIREEKKRNIKDRENERDRTVGNRVIQGTYWHPEDAYRELEKQRGVITFRMPAIAGDPRKFFEFWDLDRKQRVEKLDEYTEECMPVFKHLDLMTLADSCDQQRPRLFSSQMLLAPEMGGQQVFDIRKFIQIDIEDVPEGLPCVLLCDPAFKKPENKFTGDYNAIGVIAWDRFGRTIVVDGAYRNDWSQTEVFAEAARMIKAWKPLGFWMEQKFQTDVNEHWQPYAFKAGLNHMPFIMPLKKAGSANKALRIQSLEPHIEAGKIVLVRDIPISRAILKEAEQYDRITGASNDDALDMLAQAFDPAVGNFSVQWEDSDVSEAGQGTWEDGKMLDEEPEEVWLP
jgi:predicted phage terminase large subunit-like protein